MSLESIHKALSEMEEREKAATKGPWIEDDGHIHSKPLQEAVLEWVAKKRKGLRPPDAEVAHCYQDLPNFEADGDFIIHSRQDLPKLIKALRVAVEAMQVCDPDISLSATRKISSILSETPQ